ncbi:conserved hypothetical protein [Chthoniobacter flavus Ellin428]|uniref:Ferritin-like domain-containing protein n=1 Tax=Chthoniobacter flavus Ellin428 TaxID=497964 RepID=B4CZC7_9BACT|nr:ferritin-like domain-containing protein [Chthoniobacter flavus]EDY20818.1 conserved hypothetical protein [Chthoniobacter flavus Ellin428]TCO89709.1 para-aminobenzoate N-oxygenase AurF [Chthoniobacter flavus]
MNSTTWLHYYQQNRLNRPEPQWDLPLNEHPAIVAELARSLSHFQLGESGEGTHLLREARRTHADDPAYQEALVLFIAEEQEHARLLQKLVERYRGRLVSRHWTHTLFRLFRRALGMGFELQVLVIAELIGTAYYRLLENRSNDPVLREVCELVLRDEAKHIAFHAERFGASQTTWLPVERALWLAQFQALFLAALQVAWTDHHRTLRTLRIGRGEFQREARHECVQFLASFAGVITSRGSVPSPVA